MQLGARIDETGVVLRDGDTLVFRRDDGGRYVLDARRVDVTALGQPARLLGTYAGPSLVDVDWLEAL